MNTILLSSVLAGLLLTFGVILSFSNEVYSQTGNCDPAYPSVCIASPPPDLNCPDVPEKGFTVLSPDPHGFDPDGDGMGCHS
jgi:hypothetical protein